MMTITFYYQVHQPYRLRKINIFDLGTAEQIFDEGLNRAVINKVADKCYIPTNKLLLDLIKKYDGRFKVAFSISGVALEQFQKYRPEVIDGFAALFRTGCVECIGETYYHSLACLHDEEEFLFQVNRQLNMLNNLFGILPTTFRNTELIYSNKVGDMLERFKNYDLILTEGADKVMQWRSPLYVYKSKSSAHNLLFKYYKLADDIAFRFSDRGWVEWPLTVDKFARWISQLGLIEKGNKNLTLNLFMDYETFGEHQWEETGIFKFLERLPEEILGKPKYNWIGFGTPSDALQSLNYHPDVISIKEPISWADRDRDTSAWLGNDMQKNAAESLYRLLREAKAAGAEDYLDTLRKLSTSDHFYYMSTKMMGDGEVHQYFSPFSSPEGAYQYFLFALTDIEEKLGL